MLLGIWRGCLSADGGCWRERDRLHSSERLKKPDRPCWTRCSTETMPRTAGPLDGFCATAMARGGDRSNLLVGYRGLLSGDLPLPVSAGWTMVGGSWSSDDGSSASEIVVFWLQWSECDLARPATAVPMRL